MNQASVAAILQVVRAVLANGGPGNNPQTFNVDRVMVTINPIHTATERGYELSWVDGTEAFTVRMVANSPFGVITQGWN